MLCMRTTHTWFLHSCSQMFGACSKSHVKVASISGTWALTLILKGHVRSCECTLSHQSALCGDPGAQHTWQHFALIDEAKSRQITGTTAATIFKKGNMIFLCMFARACMHGIKPRAWIRALICTCLHTHMCTCDIGLRLHFICSKDNKVCFIHTEKQKKWEWHISRWLLLYSR